MNKETQKARMNFVFGWSKFGNAKPIWHVKKRIRTNKGSYKDGKKETSENFMENKKETRKK